jgi:hypothetical protein
LEQKKVLDLYGERGFVDLREVQLKSEKEGWPFRLYRVRKNFYNPDSLLFVMGDHCEFVESKQEDSEIAQYWRLEILKKSRKSRKRIRDLTLSQTE